MSWLTDSDAAFPHGELHDCAVAQSGAPFRHILASTGMTLRDYFIAHAPAAIPEWFKPVMLSERPARGAMNDKTGHLLRWGWDAEQARQRALQWPGYWADAQLELRRDRSAQSPVGKIPRDAAYGLVKACKSAIVMLKGRENDEFLRDAIEAATGVRP